MGMWLTAVLAAGMAGAGPITTQTAVATLDADFPVHASVICEASTAQWTVSWAVMSNAAVATVLSAADPGNGVVLRVSGWEINTERPVFATASIAGAVTVIAFEMTIRVPGESFTRTIQRQLDLGGACAAAELPACVDRLVARYLHTFDGPAGLATVRVDGAPPCTDSSALLRRSYWPVRDLVLDELALGYLGPARPRVVLYMDRYPCDNLLELDVAGGIAGSPGNRSTGPLGAHTRVGGRCLIPEIVRADQCSGMTIQLSNAAEARLSGYFTFVRAHPDRIERWRYSLAPGESRSFFVLASGDPPTASVFPQVNGISIGEIAWVKPATCTGHDLPPVRTPSPGATPPATERPLPPIRR